jgi:antitoxin component of RelBE/YafQ-DinJ toxin-antitoxin module
MQTAGRYVKLLDPNYAAQMNNGTHAGGLAYALTQGFRGFEVGNQRREDQLAKEADQKAFQAAMRGFQGQGAPNRTYSDPTGAPLTPGGTTEPPKGFEGMLAGLEGLTGPRAQELAFSAMQGMASQKPDRVTAADLVKVPDGQGGFRYQTAQEALGQPAYQQPPDIQVKLMQAGYQPGTPEYQQAARDMLNKQGGVTVNMPKGADELSKLDAQFIGGMRQGVQKMRESMPDLQRVRAALDQFGTGPTANIRLFLGSLANDLGLPVDPSLQEGELIQSIQSRLAPAMRQTGSGSSSDRDVSMFLAALPNLLRTPEGNRQVVDHLERIAQRKAQELQFAEKYYRQNGYSLIGMYDAMDRELGPVFTPQDIAAMNQTVPQAQEGLPRMPSNTPPPPENFFLVE